MVERRYKVPGGNIGIWLVSGLGFITCIVVLALGFLPPSQINIGRVFTYEAVLIGGMLGISTPIANLSEILLVTNIVVLNP